jgi:hypothetical protein
LFGRSEEPLGKGVIRGFSHPGKRENGAHSQPHMGFFFRTV